MSKQNKENTQSFMNNVTIILISQVLVKVLGMVYRIVITNIDGFGDEGLGFYNVGFQIYTLLLAISSVGIPNAISKWFPNVLHLTITKVHIRFSKRLYCCSQ